MLEIAGLCVNYGQVPILNEVSLKVGAGEIVSVIGANGAGKSTLLKAITSLLKSRKGNIVFKGEDITGVPTEKLVQRGISLAPEGRQVFPTLSVADNLLMGAYSWYGGQRKEEYRKSLGMVYNLFPRLKERLEQKAGSLSGGEQQMLALGRALMSKPSLLLVDEASLGLAPLLVNEIYQTVQRLPQEGISILLVEQHAMKALAISQRAYVLETGRIVLEGTGAALLQNEQVKKSYLGID